jgi:hypothetical protein
LDNQTFINAGIAICGTLAGAVIKALWDSIKELRESDKELADKVHSIETLVAGEYVKRDEFMAITSRLFEKLDNINVNISSRHESLIAKLDNKIDKKDYDGAERRRLSSN